MLFTSEMRSSDYRTARRVITHMIVAPTRGLGSNEVSQLLHRGAGRTRKVR